MAFGSFGIVCTVIFIAAVSIIVLAVVKGAGTWNKNNNSPRITVPAVIVSRRREESHHTHANAGDISGAHGYHTDSQAWYYITFRIAGGDRIEFLVSSSEYGMLTEGDEGDLSFQGTRYLAFERKR